MVLSWFWLKQFCHTVSLKVYLSTQAIIVTKVNSMWISERKLKQISVPAVINHSIMMMFIIIVIIIIIIIIIITEPVSTKWK